MNDRNDAPSAPNAPAASNGPALLRFSEFLADTPWRWRIGAALLALAVSLALRLALMDALGARAAYFTFYPAIIVAALVCGLRGGVAAVAVAVAVTHTSLGGVQIASFDTPMAYMSLFVFLFNSAAFILLARLLQRFAVTRRDSEELIRLNAEQLGHFVEQAPAAMAMFDLDMRYIAVSARWREDYGMSRDVVGKSHYEVFPEIGDEWKEMHQRALAGENIRVDEDVFVRQDGSSRWIRWEVRPWFRAGDGVGGVVIFSEDISEHIRARQALQESEERLRFALRAANAGVWEWDQQTSKGVWSDEFWRLLGLAPGSCEPSFDAWLATIHPSDRQKVARAALESASNGRELQYEWRMLDATGAERWLMSRGGPMRRSDRAPRYMGVTIDVTERKKAEQALRDNESRLDAIVNSAMEAIVSIDRKGAILSVNPAARELFGYEESEMLGRNVRMLMPEPYRAEHDGYIANYLRSGDRKIIGLRRQVEGKRKDGGVFPLELTVGEAAVNHDRIFVGFLRDLSPIENEKRRVATLRDELFHVSRLNDMGEVVAGLAHEVGQPIAAILNFSAAHRRAMTATGEPPEPDVIARIEAQARRAAEILKRLRGFIEKRPPEHRTERLQDLIDDAIKLAFLRSRARIERMPPAEGEADLRVCVDAILIEQVLVNLLRNADDAVMDTPDPEIWIETAGDEAGMVTISVADNGAGVDPETASELFSPFYSTKQFGMGVGLSIGKHIVESHHGAMSYRPNAPCGSIFEFTLPVHMGDDGACVLP